MATVRIPLNHDKFALIDEEDAERVLAHRWRAVKPRTIWYAYTKIDQKDIRLHRFIMQPPRHLVVDHVNDDGLDNRRKNLRVCTNQQNVVNQRKHRNNLSGYRGVSWDTPRGRWTACLKVARRTLHLGRFMNIEDAARAYDIAAREHFGEFARLNFP